MYTSFGVMGDREALYTPGLLVEINKAIGTVSPEKPASLSSNFAISEMRH